MIATAAAICAAFLLGVSVGLLHGPPPPRLPKLGPRGPYTLPPGKIDDALRTLAGRVERRERNRNIR